MRALTVVAQLQRRWRYMLPALFCALAAFAAPAQAGPAAAEPVQLREDQDQLARAQGAVSIRVHAGGWGAADPRDIARVLSFVADVLAPAFPRHAGDVIDITYRPEGPVTMLERMPDGAYRMYLAVQDTRWDQFTYQFSHEYCHIVTNAEQRVRQDTAVRATQWFEESLCEAISLLALQRIGPLWERAAPVATVPGYAGAFGEYAAQLINQAHRRLPPGTAPERPLETWYLANRADLQRDPYVRAKNEVVANALYAWLDSTPGALEAIGYLGVDGVQPVGAGQAFSAYLERWRTATPPRLRDTLMRVPALFGITLPDAPAMRVATR